MFSNSEYTDNYLYYACMLSKCTVIFDKHDAVAAVSYNNESYQLYINTEKFNKYKLSTRLAILKHEMLHILNGHLQYRRNSDTEYRKMWNIAFDCAINQMIDINHLPENCILPEYFDSILGIKVKRFEASEYYYDLIQNNKDKFQDSLDNTDSEHEFWNDSDDITESSQELQNKITEDIISDAKETALRIIGSYPSEYSKWLKIHQNKHQINWKKILKSYIKTNTKTKTIYKPNRRQPDRLDLKGSKKNKIPDLLFIMDSSGSVKNHEFSDIISALINICTQFNTKIKIIQVDSEASEPEILTNSTKLIERKRSAGTFLSAALRKAEERKLKYTSVIVGTDGYLNNADIDEFVKLNKHIYFLIPEKGTTEYLQNKSKKIKCLKISE